MPQIGYSATSSDLSNKHDYRYFMRMVPSDHWQAKAMVELVKRLGWQSVYIVYTTGNYGERGFDLLTTAIKSEQEICIVDAQTIKANEPNNAEFDRILDKINAVTPRPNVRPKRVS